MLFSFSKIIVIAVAGVLLHGIIDKGTAVTIFKEFFEKCRSCVLLNETVQKSIWKIRIIRNNNYTFYVYIAQ